MSQLTPLEPQLLHTRSSSAIDEELSRLADPPPGVSYAGFVVGIAILLGLEWYGYLFGLPYSPKVFAFLALLIAVAGAIYAQRRRGRTLDIRLGRERVVRETLESLQEEGMALFHDLPGEGFSLDHIVVSNRGVFVVSTILRPKPSIHARVGFKGEQILFDGLEPAADPVLRLRAQIRWLANLLEQLTSMPLPVRGVLVIPGWAVDAAPESLRCEVRVLEPRSLPAHILREPVRLSDFEVSSATSQLVDYVRSRERTRQRQ